MEEEKERGPDLMLVKVKGQFTIMKTSACFPILPSWPDIMDIVWKSVKSTFWVNITYFLFSSLRYLMSHTGYFSSSATVLRKVGTSQIVEDQAANFWDSRVISCPIIHRISGFKIRCLMNYGLLCRTCPKK